MKNLLGNAHPKYMETLQELAFQNKKNGGLQISRSSIGTEFKNITLSQHEWKDTSYSAAFFTSIPKGINDDANKKLEEFASSFVKEFFALYEPHKKMTLASDDTSIEKSLAHTLLCETLIDSNIYSVSSCEASRSEIEKEYTLFIFNKDQGGYVDLSNFFKEPTGAHSLFADHIEASYLVNLKKLQSTFSFGSIDESTSWLDARKFVLHQVVTSKLKNFKEVKLLADGSLEVSFDILPTQLFSNPSQSTSSVDVEPKVFYTTEVINVPLEVFYEELTPQTRSTFNLAEPKNKYFATHTYKNYFTERDEIDCRQHPCVALTFDDGPSPYTSLLLNILKEKNARSTFFIVGNNVKNYPTTLKKIHADGHEIGNHSWSHANLTKHSEKRIFEEITKTNAALKNLLGFEPSIFRPPYGASNSIVRAITGMPSILWSVDTKDWKVRNSKSVSKAIGEAPVGSIILMHDIHATTVSGVSDGIDMLYERNIIPVSVTELLGGDLDPSRVYRKK